MAKIFKKIAVFVVLIFTCTSLVYLSNDKRIFNLNYSPEIKKIALTLRYIISENEKAYLYNIGDPGIQFYFGDIRKNIYDVSKINTLIKEKNKYIIFNADMFSAFDSSKFLKIIETNNFVVVKTQ